LALRTWQHLFAQLKAVGAALVAVESHFPDNSLTTAEKNT
jgi:hypothetical protein